GLTTFRGRSAGDASCFRVAFAVTACYIAGAMDVLGAHAARHPDKPALIEGDRVWSWAEMVEKRNRLGHALVDLGFRPGEHAIVYAANSIEHLMAGTGARAAGLIPTPMNHRLVPEEGAYILDHSAAVVVFGSDQFLPVVEAVRSESRKVRRWILVGSERRAWALHVDDLLASGRPEPVELAGGTAFGA